MGGFNIFNGEKLGKLIFFIIIICFCLGVFWKVFIKPTSVDKSLQQAQEITNIKNVKEDDTSWFKLKVWGIKIEF